MNVFFLVMSILAVLGATGMVLRRNPIYGLIFLLLCFGSAAGVFYALSAEFLAFSQVLVYAGAIAVLFLFVLMFVDLKRRGEDILPQRVDSLAVYEPKSVQISTPEEEDHWTVHPGAALLSVSLLAVMLFVIADLPEERWDQNLAENVPAEGFGSIETFGKVMIQDFPLHFEVVGLIILVGVMGAVVLGMRIQRTPQADSSEGTKD